MPVVQVCLRAARVFCLVDGSLSAGFVWGSGFPVLLFILLGPDLSLSLSALLAPASRPWGFPGWGWCLSWLLHSLVCPSPSHGGLPIGIPSFLWLSSGRSFPPSWWGPALLLRWSPFLSVLLVCPGRWLLFLALSSAFCQVLARLLSSLWLGWCSAPSLRPCTRSLSLWPVGCSPFLLSRFVAVCFPGLWVSLFPGRFPRPGLLFPGSCTLPFPPPWYSRWHLDPAFCSSGVLHPTLSRDWSLVSVSWAGFSDSSVGSKVFSLTFLTLFSVGLSPV